MSVPTTYITEAMLLDLFEQCVQQRQRSRRLMANSAELRVYTDQLRSETRHCNATRRDDAQERARKRLTAST